jgi:peptidoglycan/xylan/chitin deacetylase (PgdA/CDA1 family)
LQITHWPPVLMYHAIAHVSEDPNAVCVSPETFEDQMLQLRSHGLRGVSIDELIQAVLRRSAKGLVGLTFDDGYENFLHTALPILEEFDFTATVYVVAGMLGEENSWDEAPKMRLLDARGVREAAARGMEIGAHSMSHVKLSELDSVRLREEVETERQILEEVLGYPIEGFCYPYGDLSDRVVRAVREAGYAYACAYKTELRHGVYAIPRIYAGERDRGLRLDLKLRRLPTIRRFMAGRSTRHQ